MTNCGSRVGAAVEGARVIRKGVEVAFWRGTCGDTPFTAVTVMLYSTPGLSPAMNDIILCYIHKDFK